MRALSDDCWRGDHDDCDGCCLDSAWGCACDCHLAEEAEDEDDQDRLTSAPRASRLADQGAVSGR